MSGQVEIRPATPADVGVLYALIRELAAYERSPDAVTGTPEMLHRALFGARHQAEALLALVNGSAVGFALFYGTFSTWECSPGLWLEDLYVAGAQRRAGVGEALMRELARIALARGATRLEWAALNWNEPALSFYRKLRARALREWVLHRLDGEALRTLGAGGS